MPELTQQQAEYHILRSSLGNEATNVDFIQRLTTEGIVHILDYLGRPTTITRYEVDMTD